MTQHFDSVSNDASGTPEAALLAQAMVESRVQEQAHQAADHGVDMFTYDVTKTPWIAQTSKRIPEILKSHLRAAGMPEHMVADKDIPYLLGAIWDGDLISRGEQHFTSLAFASMQVDGVRVAVAQHDDSAQRQAEEDAKQKHAQEEAAAKKRADEDEAQMQHRKLFALLHAESDDEPSFFERLAGLVGKLVGSHRRNMEAFEKLADAVMDTLDKGQGWLHLTPDQHTALVSLRTQLHDMVGTIEPAAEGLVSPPELHGVLPSKSTKPLTPELHTSIGHALPPLKSGQG